MELLNSDYVVLLTIVAIISGFCILILDINFIKPNNQHIKHHQLLVRILNMVFGISILVIIIVLVTFVIALLLRG